MTQMKIDAADVKWQWQEETGVPGTYALIGTHKASPSPVCIVWWRFAFKAKAIEIVDSFVREQSRRIGVRTAANDFMFANFDADKVTEIVTQGGTDSGAKWMKAVGYQRAKDGHWYVTRRQWEARARKVGRRL